MKLNPTEFAQLIKADVYFVVGYIEGLESVVNNVRVAMGQPKTETLDSVLLRRRAAERSKARLVAVDPSSCSD